MTSVPPPGEPGASTRQALATVNNQDHDGVTVAAITGEVDMSNVDEIARAISGLPDAAANGLVVDLAQTQYLDSSGLALLHDLASRLERRSQRLVIVSPPGSAPRLVLDVTAMSAHALCVDALSAAIDALTD